MTIDKQNNRPTAEPIASGGAAGTGTTTNPAGKMSSMVTVSSLIKTATTTTTQYLVSNPEAAVTTSASICRDNAANNKATISSRNGTSNNKNTLEQAAAVNGVNLLDQSIAINLAEGRITISQVSDHPTVAGGSGGGIVVVDERENSISKELSGHKLNGIPPRDKALSVTNIDAITSTLANASDSATAKTTTQRTTTTVEPKTGQTSRSSDTDIELGGLGKVSARGDGNTVKICEAIVPRSSVVSLDKNNNNSSQSNNNNNCDPDRHCPSAGGLSSSLQLAKVGTKPSLQPSSAPNAIEDTLRDCDWNGEKKEAIVTATAINNGINKPRQGSGNNTKTIEPRSVINGLEIEVIQSIVSSPSTCNKSVDKEVICRSESVNGEAAADKQQNNNNNKKTVGESVKSPTNESEIPVAIADQFAQLERRIILGGSGSEIELANSDSAAQIVKDSNQVACKTSNNINNNLIAIDRDQTEVTEVSLVETIKVTTKRGTTLTSGRGGDNLSEDHNKSGGGDQVTEKIIIMDPITDSVAAAIVIAAAEVMTEVGETEKKKGQIVAEEMIIGGHMDRADGDDRVGLTEVDQSPTFHVKPPAEVTSGEKGRRHAQFLTLAIVDHKIFIR